MISGNRITLPSGQVVVAVSHPAGLEFTVEGTDATLIAPDVLYLAEMIRADPRFPVDLVSGGSRAAAPSASPHDSGPTQVEIGPAAPLLNKAGGRALLDRLADELSWWINWGARGESEAVPPRSFTSARRAGTAILGEVDPRRIGR